MSGTWRSHIHYLISMLKRKIRGKATSSPSSFPVKVFSITLCHLHKPSRRFYVGSVWTKLDLKCHRDCHQSATRKIMDSPQLSVILNILLLATSPPHMPNFVKPLLMSTREVESVSQFACQSCFCCSSLPTVYIFWLYVHWKQLTSYFQFSYDEISLFVVISP